MARTAIPAEQCSFHLFKTHGASPLRNPVGEMSRLPGQHYYLREGLRVRIGELEARIRQAKESWIETEGKKVQVVSEDGAEIFAEFLGHVVSKEGVHCDPEKVRCVQNWKIPECVTEVRSFLGLASYYRWFIPEYAQIADPLTRLTEKGRKFTWNDQCQQAFEALKQKLVTAPVLAYPQTEGLMVLDTDASAVSISGCVSQIQNGEERVIAYGSKALSAALSENPASR